MSLTVFFILFMGPTVLFNLFFNLFSTLLTKKFQFQLNKLFSNGHLVNLDKAILTSLNMISWFFFFPLKINNRFFLRPKKIK